LRAAGIEILSLLGKMQNQGALDTTRPSAETLASRLTDANQSWILSKDSVTLSMTTQPLARAAAIRVPTNKCLNNLVLTIEKTVVISSITDFGSNFGIEEVSR
jgi:tRNA A37 threonylcarbamoyladenosine synthetase subunit TsaC/SUA5/YrdC